MARTIRNDPRKRAPDPPAKKPARKPTAKPERSRAAEKELRRRTPVAELTSPAWERQPAEPDRAWEAFVVYRDAGNARSIPRAAQTLSKSIPVLKPWSTRWRWGERVHAYDRHMDAIALEAREQATREAVTKMVERHAMHSEALLRGLVAPTEALLRRIAEMGGDDRAFRNVPAGQLAALVSSAARAYPLVAKLERMSRGLNETEEGHKVTVGGKVEHSHRFEAMSEDELLQYVASMRDDLAERRKLRAAPAEASGS